MSLVREAGLRNGWSLVGVPLVFRGIVGKARLWAMGTKLNPGKFDCYENAKPDEPMFILLARDPLAPMLVEMWANLRAHLAGNPSKVEEARQCAESMRTWKSKQQ